MKSIKEISHDSFYKMKDYHQISADLIEEAENLFNSIGDEEDSHIIEQLGTLSYGIGNIIEVFNPVFEIEILDLKDLKEHIENKIYLLTNTQKQK